MFANNTKTNEELRNKAVDLMVEMINSSETIQTYIEDELESFGFEFASTEPLSAEQMDAYINAKAMTTMKFLAKVMEVL